MKLLVVDDEKPAIDCVLAIIDWKSIGIDLIQTAQSVEEAKTCLLNDTIDIILCDIEMPGENGLDLIEWVQKESMNIESILLTAYDNFSYAKRAVSLGCLGYLLKPIDPEELLETIHSAIQIHRQKQHFADYKKNHERWIMNQSVISEVFWREVVSMKELLTLETIETLKNRYSVSYSSKTIITPLLYRVLKPDQKTDSMYDKIENEFSAAYYPFQEEIIFLTYRNRKIVLCIGYEIHSITEEIRQGAESVLNLCEKMHDMKIAICLGESVSMFEVSKEVRKLIEVDRENIWDVSRVYTLTYNKNQNLLLELPDMQLFSRLLLEGESTALTEKLTTYYEKVKRSPQLGSAFLEQVHHDFLQMIYFTLYSKAIYAHQVFTDSNLLAKPKEELVTASQMFQWMESVMIGTCQAIKENESEDTVIDQVKRYVKEHLGEAISREDLSMLIHISPDHLTRIVKRETGLTLTEYIQQQKMEMAKELLIHTKQKVSEVALCVGYQHFSQFAKIFKRYTGLTPQEYRMNHQRTLSDMR